MNQTKKVFVAIDFSPASDEALKQAHDRALSMGAELGVCHIIPNELRSNVLFPHLGSDAAMSIPVELERAAEAVAKRVSELTGRSSEHASIIVDHGTPYAEILKAAEKWQADVIVIGSHGMTSAAGLLLGSVTHKVIRYAHSTVLVVRSHKGGRVVAGTDFSDPALPAVAAAVNEARRMKCPLTIVHSVNLGFPTASHGVMAFGGPAPMLSDESIDVLKRGAQDRLLEALRKFDMEGDTVVTTGPAGIALVTIARDVNASLVVVGTRGGTGLERVLLGSVAETVAGESPCSVMITRLH